MTYYKDLRIVNPELVKEVKNLGYCELANFGHCEGPHDPHHIKSRGSGGGDTPDNLICLCRAHHTACHAGLFSRQLLRDIVQKRLESWTT